MPSKSIDNKEIKETINITKKHIIIVIITILLITIAGTFAWLSWKSNDTALVLTVGDINSAQVILKPYQINSTITPVLTYENEEYTEVTATNNSTTAKVIKLFYKINNIDPELVNTNFKYTITKSTDNGTTYTEYLSGDFSTASTDNELYIMEENLPESTTYKYKVYIWLLSSDENQTNIQGKSFSSELRVTIEEAPIITTTDLVSKANPSTLTYADATDSQKGEMWTFAHDATTQTSATTDYRYIGSSPNNYITFNDEVWRIIGVFDGRIKIIRNDSLGNMRWDYKKSGVGSSTTKYGSNDWTDSQLMYMLNPTSYTLKTGYSLTDGKIYDGSSNIIYQLGCKPASIASGATLYSCTSNTWSLNITALSQISEATYYLGGSSSYSGHSAETYYAFERGTTVYSGRPTSWSGLVGLMYPSDYAYAFANGVDDKCYTDTSNCNSGTPSSSWLYKSDTVQWTVSPHSSNARGVFYVSATGNVNGSNAYNSDGVRPVAYLKSDIKLQGTGTSDDPYKIIGTGADMLIKNANPSTLMYADATDSQKGEMWTFSHDATTQTSATTDYRYIGSSPNNYITFNDEVWRIIGVFDGRIKIIRNDTLGNMSWDYKQSGVGTSTYDTGSNDWTDSQLMYMLNPTSYTLKTGYSLTDSKIYDGSSNIIYQLGCKPASIASGATSYSCTSNTWSLNSTALSQISEAIYYLGGRTYDSTTHFGTAEEIYTWERGTTRYSSGRPTGWTGLVGLMYPSDYAYTFANGVDDKCYTDTYNCNSGTPSSSWLYKSGTSQWTVSPYSGNATYLLFVFSTGRVSIDSADFSYGVCPVAYLKSDIKLQGSGTSSEPYEIIG